jgi:hypothetical protein
VNYGGSQTYTITPNAGYKVAGVIVDGTAIGAVTTYSFSTVTGNHTISATYSALPTYSLTIGLGIGTTGTPATTTSYPQGTVVNYNYALQTGYQNLQVTLDGSPVAASGTVTMNGAHTLATTAQIQSFTITATAGANGTINPSGTTTVNYGGSQTYTITPNAGYKVAGVIVNGINVGVQTSFTVSNVTSNSTISVTFSQIQYTITVIRDLIGSTGNPAGTYTIGTQVAYSIDGQLGFGNVIVKIDGVTISPTSITNAQTQIYSGTILMNADHTVVITAKPFVSAVTYPGSYVAIWGANFGTNGNGATSVSINGISVPFSFGPNSSLTCQLPGSVPPGGPWTVSVVTPNGSAAGSY